MSTRVSQTKQTKSRSIVKETVKQEGSDKAAMQFADLRTESDLHSGMQDMADSSSKFIQLKSIQNMANGQSSKTIQKKQNTTGLPDNLKSGIENLSGQAMDHVKVHYNSSKPAQLHAHAFAQGNNIHLASGQEKHLPHEAWHVVQQAQGRVKPTMQMKGKIAINDDAGLEKEADVMGLKALNLGSKKVVQNKLVESGQEAKTHSSVNTNQTVQRVLAFHGSVKPNVQVLLQKAAEQYPAMAADDKFVIYFAPDESLAERQAVGNTEYGAFVKGELHLLGKNLSSVLAKAEAEKPDKLYAYITFNPASSPLELIPAMAHEMALHAVPFFHYRDIILGGTSEELEILKAQWAALVESGSLSEALQHARFGGGNIALYLSMVKKQISLLKNPAHQGELAFFFLGDYLSKLKFFRDGFSKSEAKKAVITEEMTWLLEVMGPFEEPKSNKTKLAEKFDEIIAGIEAFAVKRKAAGQVESSEQKEHS